ncbi:glycine/betaine ABC transporter substrate-binding protein [Pseudomonas lalucatii]|nr:glycine/betaine ABC transporter substrate-binding protein [Pseudomonas lalucatii]
MKRYKSYLLAALLSTPLLAQAADPAACDRVRLADVGWTDLIVTNAVTRLLLSELGYRTQLKRLSVPETYEALRNNDLDVFLDLWLPSSEKGCAPTWTTARSSCWRSIWRAKYTLAVNQAGHDAGIRTFADIAKHKKALGGKIYGIEPGNSANKTIAQMVEKNAFDLAGFRLAESSESEMILHVKRADHLKKAAVFLAWEPHPMNNQLKVNYLPGGDDYFGPNLGGATVYTATRRDYASQCPNLGRLLKNLRFSLQMENDLMEAILNQNTTPRREAKAWLKANPQTRAQWLQGVTRRDGSPLNSGQTP